MGCYLKGCGSHGGRGPRVGSWDRWTRAGKRRPERDTIRARRDLSRHQVPSCFELVLKGLCSFVDTREADGMAGWAFWKGRGVNVGVASLW